MSLESSYRRLLHAYPGSYRRRHGAEIVTTLLEMAEAGQRRPRFGEAVDLIGAGLRQRFRVPRRPPAWVAAVLALLAGAAFGAAAGSWTAEQAFTTLPSAEQSRELQRQAAGTAGDTYVDVVSGAPIDFPGVFGHTSIAGAGWDGEQARARLAADGWRTGPLHDADTGGPEPAPGFTAVRDGLELTVDAPGSTVFTQVAQIDNGWLWPLIAAGIVLGALAGWLIAAAVARRRSRPATVVAVLALAALFPPVWALIDNTVWAVQVASRPGNDISAVHTVLEPSPYWATGPDWLSSTWSAGPWINPAAAVAGLALTAVTVALALLRPGQAPVAREVAH